MSTFSAKALGFGLVGLLMAFAALADLSPTQTALRPQMKLMPQDVANAFTTYINEQSEKTDGWIQINDPVDNTALELKLQDVYKDALLQSQPNVYVACANFVTRNGEKYDVDFFLKGTNRNNLKVIDAAIHAKNGVERFAWAKDQGYIRVKPISSPLPMQEEMAH
jgi:hypothetical protein